LIGLAVFVALSRFLHVEDLGHGREWTALFVASGAMFAAQYLYMGVATYFNARRQFGRLAVSNGAQSLLSGALALGLTLYYRTPQAYLAGFALSNFAVSLYNLGTISRQAKNTKGVPFFNGNVLRETVKFGAKLVPTRAATVTMQTVDRLIITNTLGSAAMTPYGVASRLPEAAHESLPITMTLMPDLTRAHSEGEAEFAKSVDRATRVALMVGCGLILVPCTFADPVLRLWLGENYIATMAPVMVAIGIYRALEMFYSSLALTMIAHGSPQRVFPFTLYNAVMLLALVYPAAALFGIVGVAFLRVGIHVLQFGPLLAFTRNTVVPQLDMRKWLLRLLGTLAVASAVGALGIASWKLPILQSEPWLALLLAPAAMALFFALVDRLGFAELPDGVRRRIKSGLGAFRRPVG
jgi:O-antigen/teichoic acid export membrane protein